MIIVDFFMGYDEAGVIPGQKKDVFGKEGDLSIDEDTKKTQASMSRPQGPQQNSISRMFTQWFGIVNPHHYFFLALLGAFTALACFLTDLVSVYLIDCKY